MLSVWFRVIRLRFLLASVIAVSLGLSLSWSLNFEFNLFSAILTFLGVLSLHASVDLLNDYWDFKRGIDTRTIRTRMSGGTGVLPDGLLKPSSVYRVGIIFLIVGGIIGSYFVLTHGVIIAIILGFAIFSIYFYSTKIVDSGLSEFFVGVKGAMIVLGTYFIQTSSLSTEVLLSGVVAGSLSSLVLFIASFPDHDADKEKGRKTLVIIAGKEKAVNIYWVFPGISYGVIIYSVISGLFPVTCLFTLLTIPLLIKTGRQLKKSTSLEQLVPVMEKTLLFSRITGTIFVASFLVPLFI